MERVDVQEVSRSWVPAGLFPAQLSPLCLTAGTWLWAWLAKMFFLKNLWKPRGLSLRILLLSLVSGRFRLAPSPILARTWSEWERQ